MKKKQAKKKNLSKKKKISEVDAFRNIEKKVPSITPKVNNLAVYQNM